MNTGREYHLMVFTLKKAYARSVYDFKQHEEPLTLFYLISFPIWSIELVLWTDACTIWIIWYQFLLIEFCHRYTSIVLRWTVFIYFKSPGQIPVPRAFSLGKGAGNEVVSTVLTSTERSGARFPLYQSWIPIKPLLSRKMSFSPGDLIWAKVRGFRHWPARVSSIYFEIKADESEGLLSWCWSWVETRSTIHYDFVWGFLVSV